MAKKVFIIGAAVVVIAVAYILIYGGRGSAPAPAASPETGAQGASQQPAAQNPPPGSAASQPAPSSASPAQTVTVSYSNAGFFPDSVTVARGGTVVFVNQSSRSFWPASNPHPAHTGYPAIGGCTGSTFDACQPLAPGQSWPFRFDVAGTWGYHDHLHPGSTGTIVVK